VPKYHAPACQAVEIETDRVCGTPMVPLQEREPSFGPNWKPGHWVFRCPRCAAVRALSTEHIDRYAARR